MGHALPPKSQPLLFRLVRPRDTWQPTQVLLFSGHRIDAPDRPKPRFPPGKEAGAAQKIAGALDALHAGPDDLALAQSASGGDILFLEACRERGVHLQLLLPFQEPEFIQRSILTSIEGEEWRDRYYDLKSGLENQPRIMPDELGLPPKDGDSYERCNLWLLYSALSYGIDKVRFICLWDGGGGDGPGGTEYIYNEVKRRTGRVTWISTKELR